MQRRSRTNRTRTAHSPFRRTKVVAAGGLMTLAALAVLPMPGSSAESIAAEAAAVDPGQGTAIGQTWKIDPKAAGLSIGLTFGQALAGHQNKVAKAASQAINFGVIGTTLGGEPCKPDSEPTWPREKQPKPLTVDSREEGAAEGKTEYEDHIHDSPKFGRGPWKKQVKANDTPLGEAVTTTGPIGIEGVLEIGGGVARSVSGIVGGARVAQSTVDIQHINLATVVKLSDIRWEATYNSTTAEGVVGRFTIGYTEIGGTSTPTNDPSVVIDSANVALAPFGLKMTAPKAYEAGGVLFVQPLTIGVVPNPSRDRVAGQLIDGIQPIREPLFEAMLEQDCDSADLITVFDIVVGSMTGAGEFGIELGGVQATSGEIPETGFDLGGGGNDFIFDPGTPPIPGIEGSFSPGISSGGGTTYTGTATATPRTPITRQTNPRRLDTFKPAASFKGARGGAMAGVGLATLALLALFAEGDRRKMRRAQRQTLSTEE